MTPRARNRLLAIFMIVGALAVASAAILYGLSEKITYFHTPSEIKTGVISEKQIARPMRIGGMVKAGSLTQKDTMHNFIVSDLTHEIRVQYRGILPDLFREGQGVVAYGRYKRDEEIFYAEQILAKHDENYMPPEVKRAMEKE